MKRWTVARASAWIIVLLCLLMALPAAALTDAPEGEDGLWPEIVAGTAAESDDDGPALQLLAAPVRVLYPNGGESVASGSELTIMWEAEPTATRFTISYSLDNGLTWKAIIAGYQGTSYDWPVPVPSANRPKCLVRVVGFTDTGVRVGKDLSDAPFAITVVALTTPNGAEELGGGTTTTIEWETNDTVAPVASTKLLYTRDGGLTWLPIATLPGNPGSYDWLLPVVKKPYTGCRVKVALLSAAGLSVGKDLSDAPFTLTGAGDLENYFPDDVGDRWTFYSAASSPDTPEQEESLGWMEVTGTTTVLGQQASVFTQQIYAPPDGTPATESYYAKDLFGVTALGGSGAANEFDFTSRLYPYRLLLFPVAVGPVSTLSRSGMDIGQDLDGDGRNEKLTFTQKIAITGFEPVSVTAGDYPSAARQVTTLNGDLYLTLYQVSVKLSALGTNWVVPGAGAVKSDFTLTVKAMGNTATVTETSAARGYRLDDVSHGLGWPQTVADSLSPQSSYAYAVAGRPAVATDGSNFLALARRASDAYLPYTVTWVATLLGPDGAVLNSLELPGEPVLYTQEVQRSAAAFDGSNYLLVYEKDNDFASSGQLPSLEGARITPAGALLDGPRTLAAAGSNSPVLACGNGSCLLVYVKSSIPGDYGPVYGVFVSPLTGEPAGAEFPVMASGSRSHPAVSFDGSTYLVAWDMAGGGIGAARVATNGTILDAGGIPVSAAGARPALAFGGGTWLAAWEEKTLADTYARIYARRISSAGQLTGSSSFPLATGAIATAADVTLAFGNGEFWAAWQSSPSIGVYDGVKGARVAPDGTLRSVPAAGMPMSARITAFAPAMAANPAGGFLVWLKRGSTTEADVAEGITIHPFGP
jgi:hypothetical protein